jgi:hypothetical protein
MIKVYVATKFEEKMAARELMADLGRLGVSITHDWTVFETATANSKECAINDTEGVLEAEFIVILATKELHYAGSYVEFGIALGAGKPVYVIGSGMDRCVFINHPNVRKFVDKHSFLDYFKKTGKKPIRGK